MVTKIDSIMDFQKHTPSPFPRGNINPSALATQIPVIIHSCPFSGKRNPSITAACQAQLSTPSHSEKGANYLPYQVADQFYDRIRCNVLLVVVAIFCQSRSIGSFLRLGRGGVVEGLARGGRGESEVALWTVVARSLKEGEGADCIGGHGGFGWL
jgi:hypothetical protein